MRGKFNPVKSVKMMNFVLVSPLLILHYKREQKWHI